ncbi:MAG: RNA-directed DNA polymerase [Hyphomicrobiaceae bacterium]|nr:RNA-directed DNA polymerase [Hyphomicrobiaceae bacterium]
MRFEELIARNLAAAWLAGPWTEAGLFERGQEVIGKAGRRRFLQLVRAAIQAAPSDYPPSPGWITAFLRERDGLPDYTERFLNSRRSISLALEPAHFSSSLSLAPLDVPRLETPHDLAVWIGVPIEHLDWLADSRRQAYSTDIPMLQNYRYAFVPKRTGPPRLLECPKPLLMAAQRKILSGILDKIRAHDAAHGFVAGRSCLSGASRHAGEDIVIALDLKDFFLTTPVRRVHGIFRALGYPWAVARLLTGLCTSAVPLSVFRRLPPAERHDWKTRQLFNSRHLPQGAPTSPALANLAAYRLDVRLTGLARSLDATYTRYADDLAVSGSLTDRNAQKILATVRSIAREEGYEVHPSKQRVMRSDARQCITGVVVNRHVNVPREDFDRLKATLHNAARHGPRSQNRDGHADFRAHLDGRVTWVENVNPNRGAKLRRLFDAIVWKEGSGDAIG